MLFNRKELKEIKKDIMEQLKAKVAPTDLYIKGFYNTFNCNDIIQYDNRVKSVFTGKITKNELNKTITNLDYFDYKIYKTHDIFITIDNDDNEININVNVELMDKWDNIETNCITLNI